MEILEPILILMAILAGLAALAPKMKLPYPVLLVLGGLFVGITPSLPNVRLDPEVVFLIFLPPLLYEASWKISWHDLKTYRKPISRLAIGLVFLTTTVVAVVAHYCIPGFDWPLAFVLGAIVSPPDAVAATSATKGLGMPRRTTVILEGESLVNDASALIAYRYAVAAVASGSFILWQASIQFVILAIGGVLAGLAIGYAFVWALRKVQGNATVEASLNLMIPFVSYLFAEHIKVSGVLSVVATGLYVSWRSSEVFSYQGRMLSNNFWELLGFLLNGFVFILIGLQLPWLLEGITEYSMTHLILYGLLVSAAAIFIRMAWLFVISKSSMRFGFANEATIKSKGELFIIGWAGMRGVVSLATALALPLTLQNGNAFPNRDVVLFLAFIVILVTLVLQGLTLPFFVRHFNVKEDTEKEAALERKLRLHMARQAMTFIDKELPILGGNEYIHNGLRNRFEQQIRYLNGSLPTDGIQPSLKTRNEQFKQYIFSELEVINFQRQEIIKLLKNDKYPEEMIRKVEGELDVWNVAVQSRLKIIK
ncbi:Na+/H+ antiporter [Siphonobacter curvatus]|uniref:Na+/H+ antiporter n=1 Tax=Siphonobacter curvatus TaxID=2094562 RepID=A0A2S7IM12_9BACT|nr:Na+/H+ antiporter [Siphonobacter curvatus]PQA58781.1 Na+/H+ antiporter [Siphonobacter curvatus]